MKRILNRMLRYADAIVKRGVDKLIDAIGQSPEPQTKSAEIPQQQKRMGNDTDCAQQTTDNTTNCGLTEQAFTLMDEQCDMRFLLYDEMSKLPITWHLHMLSGVTLIGVVMCFAFSMPNERCQPTRCCLLYQRMRHHGSNQTEVRCA